MPACLNLSRQGIGRPALWLRAALLLALCSLTLPASAHQLDLIIANGLVYDGSGEAPVRADIGVRDGRIVAVAPAIEVEADQILDARGLAVAPGFVDAHSHVPEAVTEVSGPFLVPQMVTQGVTTMLAGPDGRLGPRGLSEIFSALEVQGIPINYACYVGHNGVRSEVMGGEARLPTDAEMEAMREAVREGMRRGCVGLSAGLMYEPGMFSEPEEIIALASEVAPFGGTFDSHSRHPVFEFMSSETETIDIGAAAGIPAKLGHLKAVGLLNQGRSGEIVAAVEAAQATGREVVADTYPYDGAATTLLRNILVFEGQSGMAPAAGTLSEIQTRFREALSDPEASERLELLTENGPEGGFSWVDAVGYGSMRIVHAPGRPDLVDRNLETMARERGIDPFEVVTELVLESDEDITITLGTIDPEDLHNLMRQSWMMIASDSAYVGPESNYPASPHPRSTGTFPRVLGHFVREVGLFPLEEAIRKMTSMPAEHLHLCDRGRIAEGYAADITIFDPQTVSDRSTYLEPRRFSTGIRHVVVNGTLILRDGQMTGATPGRFVPRQTSDTPSSSAPSCAVQGPQGQSRENSHG